MKTKNLFKLFITIISAFFLNLNANPELEEKSIDQYIGMTSATPSKFCISNLRFYFQDLYNMNKNNIFPATKNSTKYSKTDLFNKRFKRYIKDLYNNKYYSNHLSEDSSHLIEFIKLSKELNLGAESLYTCLRLFYNKIKEADLVSASMLNQFLSVLPDLLDDYFETENFKLPSTKSLVKRIEKTILFRFTDHLDKFQEKPGMFLSELSKKIGQMTQYQIKLIEKKQDNQESISRLRQIIIRFLEISLNKLIWDPTNYAGIWNSVISISNDIQRLAEHKILDHMDDLDDLFWSLTHRFCFFLDLSGSSLPVSFYEEIEADIASEVIIFLELEEQDEGIKTKKEVLTNSLIKAKAKALAFEKKGMITDQLYIQNQ